MECPCLRQQRASPTTGAPSIPPDNLPTQPSPLHTHRPLHLMRQPSINPPSFYDDVAPPPLLTPPPNYDDLTPHVEVRGGYFDTDGSGSATDEDEAVTPDEDIVIRHVREIDHTEATGDTQVDGDVGDAEEDETEEEEDIVDMVGLEDLSFGFHVGSPSRRRSSDIPARGWAS